MIIDGNKVSAQIMGELASVVKEKGSKTLAVVMIGGDEVSRRFVRVKEKFAEKIGVGIRLYRFPEGVTEQAIIDLLGELGKDNEIGGVVVQLPLPEHFFYKRVIESIPVGKDVDALNPDSKFTSPVALAVAEILKCGGILVESKTVAVVGQGNLVGKPVADWFAMKSLSLARIDINTKNSEKILSHVDVIVSGVGSSHFIKPETVRDGVVLIDAGTSESGGKLVGDIDPACAEKASLFTPVPGGVGPVVVAMLFKNLLS